MKLLDALERVLAAYEGHERLHLRVKQEELATVARELGVVPETRLLGPRLACDHLKVAFKEGVVTLLGPYRKATAEELRAESRKLAEEANGAA